MSAKLDYYVNPIKSNLARAYVEKFHYLHRKPQVRFAFGLFENETHELVGVITLAQPASPAVIKSLIGKENWAHQNKVIELNRLFCHDKCPKNTESWFIAQVLNRLPGFIIISYSDMGFDHQGIVYRASNFLYGGTVSQKRTHGVKADGKHPRATSKDDRAAGNIIKKEYSPKLRYWTTTGSKTEKRAFKKMIKWKPISWKS